MFLILQYSSGVDVKCQHRMVNTMCWLKLLGRLWVWGSSSGDLPRHLAASNGNVRATETLLENRAFPWLLDDCGKTPLRPTGYSTRGWAMGLVN
jgi:hypothetical protein